MRRFLFAWTSILAVAWMGVVWASEAPAATDLSSSRDYDWPQWRGPDRNGVAPASPKLLDRWPTNGPALLWKSEPIPSGKYGQEGGAASPVVADGRVFLYIDSQRENGKVVLTTQDLIDLGWAEDVPADLAQKLVAGLNIASEKRLNGAALEAYSKEFTASLDPKLVEKFGPHIPHWLNHDDWNWVDLTKWAAIRDKAFPTLNALLDSVRDDSHYGTYRSGIQNLFIQRRLKCTDMVICLDAATGKQIWKQEFPGTPSKVSCFWGASGTPAIWDGKCYASGSAGLYCLSVKNGSVVWQVKTNFNNSSPLVMDGAVYVMVPDLTAYDAKTGKVLWTSTCKNMNGSVVPWTSGGTNYLIGSTADRGYTGEGYGGSLFCVAAADGKTLWGMPVANNATTPVVVGADTVVHRGGTLQSYRIASRKAELLWQTEGRGDQGSPVVFQGCAYITGGECNPYQVECFDLKTGVPNWNGGLGGGIRSSSPIVADGKFFSLSDVYKRVVMIKPNPERYEVLGDFAPGTPVADCSSPTVAGGKLYLRLKDCVACYDIAEHRPYMDGARVVKDELVFAFQQAAGGLVANRAIEGLVVADATGKTSPARAHVNGASLVVDIQDAVFPVCVTYTNSGNLTAGNRPVAPFEWRSPRLTFERCETNTLVLKFGNYANLLDAGKTPKAYAVAGAKVTGVEISGAELRLATDKTWKSGDRLTLRYPAVSPSQGVSARTAELSCTVTPGYPVGAQPLREYLIGEIREKIDPTKIASLDDLDKNIKPVAGKNWKLWKIYGVDGMNAFGGHYENPLGHGCVYVHSETACKVQLGVVVWGASAQISVNGKPVYTELKCVFGQNNEVKDVELKKGWNTLLIGVTPQNWWLFSISIRNEHGDGIPTGLRYTAERPDEL